ncbi:MAG: FliH/SctL family protein [bacterium]
MKSIQSHVESFIKLMNAIRKQQEELINESEQFIVDFVFKIMEKILGSEEIVTSKIAKDKLQSVVREALNKFSDSSKYTIRVHKEIAEIWDEYKNRVLSRLPENFEISLIEDPSLNPSDCLIESDKGILDARVESQLCELKNVFKNQTNNAHSEPV